jgi:hypothetical protein
VATGAVLNCVVQPTPVLADAATSDPGANGRGVVRQKEALGIDKCARPKSTLGHKCWAGYWGKKWASIGFYT